MGPAIDGDHVELAGVARSFFARRKVTELVRQLAGGDASGVDERVSIGGTPHGMVGRERGQR